MTLPFPNVEFQPFLTEIASLKPDAVFVFFAGAGAAKFVSDYAAAGLKSNIPLYGPGFLTDGNLEAMGGALATRAEHPIKLAHLIEEQANRYGEDIKRLMGLHTARLGIKTRLQGWEVVPAGTYEAAKAARVSAGGVGVKTGDSPAPWSSDNNCTQPDPEAFADQLMAEQWGLSPFSIGRLRAGASVSADGFTLWLENGQLLSSRAIPSEPDWLPEDQEPAEQGQPDEYAVPEGDQDWPMLVELCGKVYQAQGHAGAHRWIEMLPQPYQSEMWRVLEGLDAPEWIQEQDDYSEEWA